MTKCQIKVLICGMANPYDPSQWIKCQTADFFPSVLFLTSRLTIQLSSQREFERLIKVCTHEDVKLPTKKQLETKAAQLIKIATQPMTEVGLSAFFIKCF